MRRMRWWLWGAVVLSLCSFWAGGVAGQAAGDGVVVGKVTNETSGGTIPVGAPVTVQFYSEAEWTSTYTSTLDADGTRVKSNDNVTEGVTVLSEENVTQGQPYPPYLNRENPSS